MKPYLFALVLIILTSCKYDNEPKENNAPQIPDHIVLISKNAPEKYKHYIQNDSTGKQEITSGPFSPILNKFTYLNSQKRVDEWVPEPLKTDTLSIPYFDDLLELKVRNPLTLMDHTFLVQKGDTVIFNYVNKIPFAEIKNRKVNFEQLNYNVYRHEKLFKNKYPSHRKVMIGFLLDSLYDLNEMKAATIKYYNEALKDQNREAAFLDSLYKEGSISRRDYNYRKEVLQSLMEKHKRNKIIKKEFHGLSFKNTEGLENFHEIDLAQTDSLLKFQFFRDYLEKISKYDLNIIQENNITSGKNYLDSRIRFDSIVQDTRLNQRAKNYLLPEVFKNIVTNFKVADKEKYFEKLKNNVTDPQVIKNISKGLNLTFEHSNQLLLKKVNGSNLTFHELIQENKGKWLYIDFWASWCAPCIRLLPASNELKLKLQGQNIEFINIAYNDNIEDWKNFIAKKAMQKSDNYFAVNSNTSNVIEDLKINTVPHYLIYNPKGELVHEYANWPGEGAEEQLLSFIEKENRAD